MDAPTLLLLLGGFVVLVVGGELLVRGGSALAGALGLSPLVIGLTVVAFATSAPELAVTLDAALSGSPGLAVGNVVGSNIANVLLVLGLSALAAPVVARAQLARTDVPVLCGLSLVLLLLALDGTVGRPDGALLVLLLLGYLGWSLRTARRSGAAAPPPALPSASPPERRRPVRDGALLLVGVALLVLGARWLVTGATTLAGAVGLSDLVVGLTVVAIGTSLPELATSVVAALRGEREMAIGNVVGSNLMNLGAVMGPAAVIAPGGVPVEQGARSFDLPVMVLVAVLLLPLVYTGAAVVRWEGALLLGGYAAYVAYLLLDSAEHDALPAFSGVLVGGVLPLTVLALVAFSLGERRARVRAGSAPPTGPGRTGG